MKKEFVKYLAMLAAIALIVFTGGNASFAALSSIEDLPGGALIYPYFETSPSGDQSLINIRNIYGVAVLVHFVIYDEYSNALGTFNVGLAPSQGWGFAMLDNVSGNVNLLGGGTVPLVAPALPTLIPGTGWTVGGAKKGYIMAAITMADDNTNGQLDDTNRTGSYWEAPDCLMGGAYMLELTVGWCHTMNATPIQGFANFANAFGEVGEFYDTINDVFVSFDWNDNGSSLDILPGFDDPDGIRIDPWELYLTATPSTLPYVIADDPGNDGVGDEVYSVMAAWHYFSWLRDSVATGSTTFWIVTYPASGDPGRIYHQEILKAAWQANNESGATLYGMANQPVTMSVNSYLNSAWPDGGGYVALAIDNNVPGIVYTMQTAEGGAYSSSFKSCQRRKHINFAACGKNNAGSDVIWLP